MGKMVPVLAKAAERYKEFKYNFLIICRYLNLVTKNKRIFFIRNRKLVTTLNFLLTNCGKKLYLKGNNSCKNI
jgi:hypothetical protein